jgi:hypothetical protein
MEKRLKKLESVKEYKVEHDKGLRNKSRGDQGLGWESSGAAGWPGGEKG